MQTKPILLFMTLLIFSSLACNFNAERTNQQAQAAVATAAVVSQQAEQVAATVSVVAATAAAQGQDILATVQATDFSAPNLAALRTKVASVLPDENGNVTLTFTDAELTQVIQDQQAATTIEGQTIALQNPAVQFTNGAIVFRGHVTEPIETQLVIAFQPVVETGNLRFEVINASVGSINVPVGLLQTAESHLNNTLGEAMTHLPAGVTLQTVMVNEGSLAVTAHLGS